MEKEKISKEVVKDVTILPSEIPNPMYHPMMPAKPANKDEKTKFNDENHHDNDPSNIYHEGEELPGKE